MREIDEAVVILKKGGIIAYPTEAVFGLGCDPLNSDAVMRLLQIKQRASQKGFILIADTFEKFLPLIDSVPPKKLAAALATWPGPYTWIFPANKKYASSLIYGDHETIAIRVTAHPLASMLCHAFGRPLISTSANLASQAPLVTAESVQAMFGKKLDYILKGETGGLLSPTPIRDILSGKVLR